jgi:hypothetical protein
MSDDKVAGLQDGGTRKVYPTGAMKEDQADTVHKGRFDLLPPHPIIQIAKIYAAGAVKYSSRNWQKGIPLSRFLDSTMRHLFQFIEGREDEDHLHQAMWNLMGLSWTQQAVRDRILPKDLNDLPCYMPATALDPSEWRQENRLTEGYLNEQRTEGETD